LRKIVSALSVLLTVAAISIVATPATAANTFTVTPTSGNSAVVGGSFTTKTTTDALASGNYSQTITQTWPAGRADVAAANGPDGWAVEYKVNGVWVSQAPSDSSTIEGVRTTGTTESLGVSGANQKLRIPGTATLLPGSPASIPSTGRGDGWDVVITPNFILNVFHHDSQFRLECHVKSTVEVCDSNSVYTVSGYSTSNLSSLTYYSGKAYALVQNQSTGSAAILCTNVSALPFSSCGVVDLEPGVSDAQGQLSSQQRIGTKIYAADLANNKILCFDMATGAACTEISVPGLARSNANSPAFTSVIGGRLYVTANKLYCFNVSTSQACAGYPVGSFSGGFVTNAIPRVDTSNSNAVDGACTIGAVVACYDLAGNTVSVPGGLSGLLSTPATALHGGEGYYETNAWVGSKVYWASNPNGYDWSSGTATCYDWATDAACSGFDSTIDVGASRYAFRLDPYNSNCVWANGDNGALAAFTASTGAAGCQVAGTSVIDFLPVRSCNAGSVVGFTSLALTVPAGMNLSDVRVNVFNADHEAVANFQGLIPNGSGIIDLSSLSAASTGDSFSFEITASGATDQQLSAITGSLSYIAKPAELCVTFTAVASTCPEVITSSAPIAQPGIAFASSVSKQPNGGAVTTVNQNAVNLSVQSIQPLACSKWSTLASTNETGLNANGNNGGVVDFVWDATGHPYVGGYFNDAAGVAEADNLAYWNGTAWEAVGASNGSSAIGGRVAALAISNGKLFVGGDFQDAGGVANADNFAIYDLTTHVWSGAGTDPNTSEFTNIVRAIAVDPTSGKIYVGGNFNGRLAQLDPTTFAKSPVGVNGDVNNVVHFLSVNSAGVLTVGGNFTDVGDTTYDRAATWDGTTWSPISANQSFNGQVWSIARSGTKTYVSGDFNGVQVYNSADDTWSSLGSASWKARSLAVASNGDVYSANSGFGSGFFARWDGSTWQELIDGETSSGAASDNTCGYDWCGAWKVKLDANGKAWFGGDITNVASRPSVDLFATWGVTVSENSNGGGTDNGGGSSNGGGTTTPVVTKVVASNEVLSELEKPVTLSTGSLPELKPLETMVTEAGLPVAVTLTPTVTEDGLILEGPDFSLELKASTADGTPLVLDDKGRLVIGQDGLARFSGSGFLEDTPVSLWLFSEPTFLGKTNTNNDGIFNGQVSIPTSVPDGEHTIQLNGVSKDGQLRSVSIGIVVGSDTKAEVPTKEVSESKGSFDLSWLFWLLGVVALGAFAWWFIIAKRRNDDEQSKK